MTAGSVAAEADGGRTVPTGLPGGDAEGTGAGRGHCLPATPGAHAPSRGGPGTGVALEPAHPGESLVGEPERESQRYHLLRGDLEHDAAPEPNL